MRREELVRQFATDSFAVLVCTGPGSRGHKRRGVVRLTSESPHPAKRMKLARGFVNAHWSHGVQVKRKILDDPD